MRYPEMSQSLKEIAEQLQASDKKVQLIYAFNGSGKTRLSRISKKLVTPNNADEGYDGNSSRSSILHYHAFTQD